MYLMKAGTYVHQGKNKTGRPERQWGLGCLCLIPGAQEMGGVREHGDGKTTFPGFTVPHSLTFSTKLADPKLLEDN